MERENTNFINGESLRQSSGFSGLIPQGCNIFSIILNLTRPIDSFSAIAKNVNISGRPKYDA
ncbi:hypothetical protein DERP_001136 [Dermatophagoides pteronyssinus]|uniref:Uncharacterized protein n=1 Tax=Dermatophagoides pteronyssinus TaxID=6956 RepID=A0ABQ8JE44_DERPT|nr:hypothetical protein DERP_001136 [Dermatophagoides pteronyssinus]